MAVGYTTVRVNVGAFVLDGLDLDDLFDDTPVSGKLVLEPMLEPGKPVQVDDNGVMKIKAIAPFPVDIGVTGDISHRGRDYVTVPAPTAQTTNLSQLQWKATFKDLKFGTTPVTIPVIYFWAVPGADVNLANEVNVAPGSTAVQISRGARGYGVVGAEATVEADAFVIQYETASGVAESDPIPLPGGGGGVADGGVTTAKLAADAVTSDKIASGAVNGPELGQDAVTASKIANDAVARAKLAVEVRDELDGKLDAVDAAGFLTEEQADTHYAPAALADEVPRDLASFVTVGDSRTMLNGAVSLDSASASGTIAKENRGYVTQSMVMMRQRLRWLKNGGVGGDTVAQMLARTDALLALNPGWLIGMGCINSVNTEGATAATITGQLTQIFDKCAAKGVRVVWGTDWISGGTNTAAKRLAAAEVNNWLRQQATRRPNFYLADYAAVMGDTETGIIPVALGQDALHQDAPGAFRMAQELARVLGPLVPPSDRLLAYNGDPTNYLTNGMFTGNTGGLATGWSKGTSTATPTKVARTDGLPGEWQQISCTNETVTSLTRQVVLSGTDLVEGVPIFAELEFETDAAGWDATEMTLQLQTIGGNGASSSNPKVVNDMVLGATSPLALPRIASGVLRTPSFPISIGATHLQFSIRFRGTGVYRVSRARIARTGA